MLHKKIQRENYIRLSKVNEYKRMKIVEKHNLLAQKFNHRKFNNSNVQNSIINKGLNGQDNYQAVEDLIRKLKMEDPREPNKRKRLMKALSDINTKLDLKLSLNP